MASASLWDRVKSFSFSDLYGSHNNVDKNKYRNQNMQRPATEKDKDVNVESTEDIIKNLDSYLNSHASSVAAGKVVSQNVLFKINGVSVFGEFGKNAYADEIPLFKGASIDIRHAVMKGVKGNRRQPNSADGTGALLTILPDELDTALIFPMQIAKISERYVEGTAEVSTGIGFGSFNRIEVKKAKLENDKVILNDAMLINNPSNVYGGAAAGVPIGNLIFDETGLQSGTLSKEAMYAFLNFNPKDFEAQKEESETTSNTTEDTTDDSITSNTEEPETITDNSTDEEVLGAVEENAEEAEEAGDGGDGGDTIFDQAKESVVEAISDFASGKIDDVKEKLAENGLDIDAGKEALKEDPIGTITAIGETLKDPKGAFTAAVDAVKGSASTIDDDVIGAVNEFAVDNGMDWDSITEAWGDASNQAGITNELTAEKSIGEDNKSFEAEAGASISIPIAPLLNLKVGAGANFEASYSLGDFDLTKPTLNLPERKIKGNSIHVSGGASANASAIVSLFFGLGVGISNVAEITGKLEGSLGADVNSKVQAEADFGIVGGKNFKLHRLSIGADIKAELKATLEAIISLDIFTWSQDLYSKNLAEFKAADIRGALAATKSFEATNNSWDFTSKLSGDFFNNAFSYGKDRDKLQEIIKYKESSSYGFANSKDNYEKIIEDLKKAQEFVAEYKSGENLVMATEDGPKKIFSIVQAIEDKFYSQSENAKQQTKNCIEILYKLQQNSVYIKAKSKNETYERFQVELAEVKRLLGSDDTNEQERGKIMLNELKVSIGDNEFIKNSSISNAAAVEALKELKDVDALIAYEEKRRDELSERFNSTKKDAAHQAISLKIARDEPSEKLYSFYEERQKKEKNRILGRENHLEKHFIKDVATQADMLEYLGKREENMSTTKIEKHDKRIAMLLDYYNALGEGSKNQPNVEFYDKYKSTGFFSPKRIFEEQYKFSQKDQFKTFIKEYLNKKGALKFLDKKIEYENMSKARAALIAAGGETSNLDERLSNQRASVRNDFKDKDKKHIFATNDDFIKARQNMAKVKQLEEGKKPEAEGQAAVTVTSQIKEKLIGDTDAINKLIAFEGSRSNKSDKVYAQLETYKLSKEFKANTSEGSQAQNEAAIKDRYALNKMAVDYYFENIGRGFLGKTNIISDAVRKDFDINDLYSSSDLEAIEYDGKGKDENLSVFEQRKLYGAKNDDGKLDNDKNNSALKSVIGEQLTDDRMLAYYDYMAREKENAAVTLFDLANSSSDYQEIVTQLEQAGSKDVLSEYTSYIQKHAESILTPNRIMSHEMIRESAYANKYKSEMNAVLNNDRGALEESKHMKDFAEKQMKKDGNKITLEQIYTIENYEQDLATQKHTDRIEVLRKGSAEGYEGKRFDVARSAVKSKKAELLDEPNSLQAILELAVATNKEENDEEYATYKETRESLENNAETFRKQSLLCEQISLSAGQVVKSPKDLFTKDGVLNEKLINSIDETRLKEKDLEEKTKQAAMLEQQATVVANETEDTSSSEMSDEELDKLMKLCSIM